LTTTTTTTTLTTTTTEAEGKKTRSPPLTLGARLQKSLGTNPRFRASFESLK
jgi:hypothetical protein